MEESTFTGVDFTVNLADCTSPSQLQEVTLDQDVTFSNTMNIRSPNGGSSRGRSVKEFEEQLTVLRKENFDLKLRIYFLEERMGNNFDLDKENVVKKNIELMVDIENVRKQLQEKDDLLCQAVKAMELEDEEHKKTAQSKDEQLVQLQQEVEDLRVQLQEIKYEPEGSSSHKSFSSEPIYYSKQIINLDTQNIIKELQEKINSLEDQLTQEKENNASIQIILDQAENIKLKYESLQKDVAAKEIRIASLTEEIQSTNEKLATYEESVRDLEMKLEDSAALNDNLSEKLQQKNKLVDDMLTQVNELRRKYANCKIDLEREHKRVERMKMMTDLKITELEEENEKYKTKIGDLQGKLEAAMLDVKKNQNLAVSKSPAYRPSANTDAHSISVKNPATPDGAAQKDPLHVPVKSSSQSSIPTTPEVVDVIYLDKILEGGEQHSVSKRLIEQLKLLKDEYEVQKQKIIKLKAEQMKACKIIKGMIDSRNKCTSENNALKRQVEKLESELGCIVGKPSAAVHVVETSQGSSGNLQAKVSELNITAANPTDNERTMAESQGDGIDLVEHYKALTDELEEKIKILMATMKEKDLQMVSLKEQYEEVLQNLQVREDRIVDLEFELLSSSQTKGSAKKCLFSEQANIEAEKSISFYIKQVEEKDLDIERLNSEIQKLNSEVNKRTGDLQGLINKELWEKNRYIEKLQNRHTAAIETKDKEIAELRSDLSCKDMQLNVLKDNISELGIEISMETLSQNTDIENVKKLEAQLKAAIEERKYFENKIQQLEEQYASYASEDEKVMFIEKLREDISNLQKEYEHSEQLRRETNEICSVLSSRLEELAVFLDSLLKQKSVLGFLGSKENKMLRQIIDQSLDLSRTFNMSMLPSNDQSLMQLSNLTSILNTSEVETQQVADESKQGEDDNTSLSIIPENITLTYRSHLYSSTVSNRTEDITEAINPHIIKALRNQVQNLKYELQLRDVELNKLNEAIYQQKNESNLPDDDRDNQCISLGVGDNIITEKRPNSASKPSSPNKSGLNTSSTLKYQNENQSESEAWSEPDRSVSKARIGLDTPNSSRPSSGKRSKLTCKVSSESTEDDCVRGLSRTPSKKSLIENRQTIIELHKQLCDLEEKLLEKDTKLTKLEASNTETNNLLKDEMLNHNKIRSELENLEVQFKDTQEQLASAERLKADAENKLQHLENVVEGLRSEKEKLEMHLEGQTKDMYEQLNILESEKNQVMIEAKETEKDLENVRAELKHAENKLVEMQEVMNNIEGQLREEYTGHVISKLKDAEEEFVKQLRITEEKAQTEMRMSQEKIKQMEQEYAQDFIRKCEVDSIILEMEKSIQENDVLKSTIYEREQTIDKLKSKEKEHKNKLAEYQERIHVLSKDLDNTTLQYSQAVLENTKLANEKVMLEQELSKFSQKESEMKQQISEIQTELQNVKQNYQKQVSLLQDQKIKLEIKISELESANAELHNRLISLRTNTTGDQIYSSSLPSTSGLYDIGNRDIPVNQLMNRKRQFTEYVSEAQMVGNSRDVGLQFGQPLPLNQNNPAVDMERHEANSSPDLGIESDHGRFSSLEAQLNIPRPLLQTLELTESMNNLLDAENNQIQSVDCGTEHCCKKTLEMAHENSDLKKKLMRTRRALEETVTQLTLANKRKKQVEKTICKQIHMTSQVLRKAKANLDSGSETDVYKK